MSRNNGELRRVGVGRRLHWKVTASCRSQRHHTTVNLPEVHVPAAYKADVWMSLHYCDRAVHCGRSDQVIRGKQEHVVGLDPINSFIVGGDVALICECTTTEI